MVAPAAGAVSAIEETRYRKTQRPSAWKDQDLDEDSSYGANANNDYVDPTANGDYDLEGSDFRYLFSNFYSIFYFVNDVGDMTQDACWATDEFLTPVTERLVR